MLPEFEEAGATLLAITPQLPAISVEQVAERKLRIPLLQDAGNAFARRLGLVWTLPADLRQVYLGFGIDLAASNGDESWTLPMPARYIVDSDGIVTAASVHPDYTTRPEPTETLELVRSLART
jgi:peroxiredoxin